MYPNYTRVPQGDPTLDELDKFRAVLLSVLTTGREVLIRCDGLQEAKRLRRRLYSLRDKLGFTEQDAADCVAFAVVGIRVRCTAKPNVRLGDEWTQRITIGAPVNDTNAEGNLSQSNRLNDAGGPGKL